MVDTTTLFFAFIIVFSAFIIKGATGFGENLIMIPFLLLFWDVKFVLAVTLTLVLIADFYLIYKFHEHINWKLTSYLFVPAIAGIVVGTYLLSVLDSMVIKKVFALFVIAFALKSLLTSSGEKNKTKKIKPVAAITAGASGGLTSGLLGAGGPPLIMYTTHLQLKKAVFRATLVMTFFLFDLVRVVTYFFSNILSVNTLKVGFTLAPGIILGSFIGMKVHDKLSEQYFRKIVLVVLMFVGVVLLLKV
jgi:uncharacterized membrane protein YfcA